MAAASLTASGDCLGVRVRSDGGLSGMLTASPSESSPSDATGVIGGTSVSGCCSTWTPSISGECSALRLFARELVICGRGSAGVQKKPGFMEVSPLGSTSGFGFPSRIPSTPEQQIYSGGFRRGLLGVILAFLAGFLGISHLTGFLIPSLVSLSIALSAVSGRARLPR